MSSVAVVILNYNGKSYLERFLPTLIDATPLAFVIIADNASSDDSVAFLKTSYPDIKLIELEKNHGFAGGYNKALSQITADYYVLLNSDVEVTNHWLEPMKDFLDNHPEYAACQPKILDFNKREKFEYAGAAGGFLDAFGYPFCRGRLFDSLELDHDQFQDSDILWGSGACLMIRSKTYHAIGRLDEDFFAHMEEIDLCWRIWNNGEKIRFISQSSVYHIGGGTLDKSSPLKTYLNFRNGLYLLFKNLPIFQSLWKIPFRILLDWVAALKFLLSGRIDHFLAVFRAHISTLLSLHKMIKKRKTTRKGLLKPYSIVFQYYVNGKRKFDEL